MSSRARGGSTTQSRGIVNKGGAFSILDDAKLSGEVAHHMPQNAFNRTIGLSRGRGPALGMTVGDHALTNTFRGRGIRTLRQYVGLAARQRLAKDIKSIRQLFGTKYNEGLLELIEYAKTLTEFAK